MAIRTGSKVVVPSDENTQEEVQAEVETKAEPEVETPKAEKQVAVRKPTAAPAVIEEGKVPSFKQLENAMDPEEVGNTFVRVIGANGNIQTSEGLLFGEHIDIQVLSTSTRYMVTPEADPKDKEARKFCRASYDGSNIVDQDGNLQTIDDYIAENERFYPKFKKSKYLDVYAIIFNAHKNKEAAEAAGIVQISVSPTAAKPFNAFFMQGVLAEKRGLLPPSHRNCMRIKAEPKTKDTQNYTILLPELCPADALDGYEVVLM